LRRLELAATEKRIDLAPDCVQIGGGIEVCGETALAGSGVIFFPNSRGPVAGEFTDDRIFESVGNIERYSLPHKLRKQKKCSLFNVQLSSSDAPSAPRF
jgi:hypothetical protein